MWGRSAEYSIMPIYLASLCLRKKKIKLLWNSSLYLFVRIYSTVTKEWVPHLYCLGLSPGCAAYGLCNFGKVT